MKKNQITLSICIILLSFTVCGQTTLSKTSSLNNSKEIYFDDRVIQFENDTKTEEIIINIKEKTPVMELNINGRVSYGTLNVEVFNPKGERIRRVKIKVKLKKLDENGISIGEINKFIKNPELGNWKVKLSAAKVTGEIKIKANFENDYYINTPEVFIPNGNGNNNILNLETHNIAEVLSFQVYNRWGKLVFLSKNINDGWDGKVENELQKSGTYFYTVKAITSSGKEVTKNGFTYLGNK